jgi:hypothetical protein
LERIGAGLARRHNHCALPEDVATARKLVEWADERYRGGPLNPINDADLEAKFRMCAEGAIDDKAQAHLLDAVAGLEKLSNATALSDAMIYDAI